MTDINPTLDRLAHGDLGSHHHHDRAADHHEKAAEQHRLAARAHRAGDETAAGGYATKAWGHGAHAQRHATESLMGYATTETGANNTVSPTETAPMDTALNPGAAYTPNIGGKP